MRSGAYPVMVIGGTPSSSVFASPHAEIIGAVQPALEFFVYLSLRAIICTVFFTYKKVLRLCQNAVVLG